MRLLRKVEMWFGCRRTDARDRGDRMQFTSGKRSSPLAPARKRARGLTIKAPTLAEGPNRRHSFYFVYFSLFCQSSGTAAFSPNRTNSKSWRSFSKIHFQNCGRKIANPYLFISLQDEDLDPETQISGTGDISSTCRNTRKVTQ